MKGVTLLGAALLVGGGLSLDTNEVQAQGVHFGLGGVHVDVGNPHGGWYGGGYYRQRSYHGGYWGGHSHWHDTSHYDWHPGGYYRHGNHYHYTPGHYDWHETGHWHHHH